MTAYYNENDAYAAEWLCNLVAAGLVPQGDIDDRSICAVHPGDLGGYDQCHFFAGIGGWPLALQMAGWDNSREVWTGSCPCQPLSSAGQRGGHADERHLWPAFYRLISECSPPTVFGEQVAGKLGREWLAGVRADLEAAGYAVGAVDLCAASQGSPHIRQRLYWVANADSERWEKGDSESQDMGYRYSAVADGGGGFWADFDAHEGDDGKFRRSGPGAFPLAHGVPGRVGRLRSYGNAIVPQVAAEFVRAFLRG